MRIIKILDPIYCVVEEFDLLGNPKRMFIETNSNVMYLAKYQDARRDFGLRLS